MTTELFKKLNLKDQKELVILNAPPEFELELTALSGLEIRRQLKAGKPVDFLLAFQTRKADVEALLPKLAEAARGDAVLWLVYPKGTSKKYTCDFNRDSIWPLFEPVGFLPVRMISIDENWSAFRFRRQEYVKTKG